MAFTTPRTWVAGEIVTADIMNAHIRDNQNYLKERLDGTAKQFIRTATDYTTTSTSFVDVDGTNMSLTLTTDGSDVLVIFASEASNGGNQGILMAVKIDTTDYTMAGGASPTTGALINPSFTYIFRGLSAASHTFILRWKASPGGTATLVAGTTLFDVREMIGLAA